MEYKYEYFFLMNIICKRVSITLIVKNSNSSHFYSRTRHLNSPEKTLCKENGRDMEKTRVTANCRLDVGDGLTDRHMHACLYKYTSILYVRLSYMRYSVAHGNNTPTFI